jgi:tetratricopeptide (TPR) repeat protein
MLAVAACAALLFGCAKQEPPIFKLIQLMQDGKNDEAIALGEELTAENPDNTQAHRFLLRSAFDKNEAEEYRKKYEDLARANPEVAGYRFGLGYILVRLEDMESAMEEFQKARELNPDLEYINYMIGWVYFNPAFSGRDQEKALAEWEKEEQLNPRSLGALQVYADRADYYVAAGDPDNAIKDYEKVALYGFAREDIKGARERITGLRALKDELARLEAEIRANPGEPGVVIELGKMQYGNAMFAEAVETWTKAVEAYPENVELRNYLGKVVLESGNAEEATKHLQKVIELDPTHAMAYYNLAVAEDILEKNADAVGHYKKYLELNPMTTRLDVVKQRIAELEEKAGAKEEG